ncbi:MAG TPA: DUF1801 domain-containing protein [Lentimicrobium sp.]|nr:DUF1801 domain-containing protein [Lentimicrobium sp.]
MEKVTNVDEYISGFEPEVQEMMLKLRFLIKTAAPMAVEMISYGMPSYKVNGRPLVYFAAHTRHLGLYPAGTSTVDFFKKQGFEGTKGSVHFPFGKPLPEALISEAILFRVNENMSKKKK